MDDDIERVLWTEDQISQRVSELASQISQNFTDNSHSSAPVVVGVATGAFLFLADLVRKIKLPISVDFIRADSYGSGTVSNGAPKISFDLKVDVRGKHVILVEDIVDTGNTLSCLIAYLKTKGASSVSVCTLLDKPVRRKVHVELIGEGKYYCGFEVPTNTLFIATISLPNLYLSMEVVMGHLKDTWRQSTPTKLEMPKIKHNYNDLRDRHKCRGIRTGFCREIQKFALCWTPEARTIPVMTL